MSRSRMFLSLFVLLLSAACATPSGLKPITQGVDSKRPQIDVRLERVRAGGKTVAASVPTNILPVPLAGTNILAITEKPGRLVVVDLDSGERSVLVTTERMGSYPEMGLVGLVFHPEFAENRRLFTYRVAPNPDTKGSPAQSLFEEWTLAGDTVPEMTLGSVGTVFQLDQPQEGHQSGGMTFGPDGYLYVPLGDGGFQNDPRHYGQDTTNHHGSILRLDVDNREQGQGYSVPADNPFIEGGHLPETWAYGFRNPWRSAWTEDGRYIVADVGQNAAEEINIITRGGNYGWNLKEGSGCHRPRREREGSCEDPSLIDPVYEYRHNEGAAIIGGSVYSGSAIPELRGQYVFGDNTNGKLWALTLPDGDAGTATVSALGTTGLAITTFGLDSAGEILVGTYGGRVYRIVGAPQGKAEAGDSSPPGALARRGDTVDVLHGVEVSDPYRYMEDAADPEVAGWTDQRNAAFDSYTDGLAQREWLNGRFQHLWRYDDESVPSPCLLSERVIHWTKQADQDKWVVHMREKEGAESRVIIDPNTWGATETLSGFKPSPDCRYAAFGKAKAGDENPVYSVMDLDSGEVLSDSLQGWKQGGVSWLHDNSGFYYSAKPLEGEVPEGEHEYWHRAWFHRLGTAASEDVLFAHDTEVKETWHGVTVSEDGKWLTIYRSIFNKNDLWLQAVGSDERVPVAEGMEGEHWGYVVEGRLVLVTDWDAPNYRVMTASVDAPGQEHWQELIPQSEDRLGRITPIGGYLYATNLHNAATRIDVWTLDGEKRGQVDLPTVGSASVSGYWSKPRTLVSFSTFTHPRATYSWDQEGGELTLVKESPIDIDPSGIVVDQVWYPSKDGTQVSMFVVHHESAPQDGSVPFLLTGYGGFNISMKPRFSTLYATWIEAGGAIAIPNLRGGGEYGREWHEAGMRDQKQNVFDDFIAAAEWLENEGWTHRDRLAISGGSNGGLLVSAAVTQRPELFEAVLCAVPLTDMVRFHHMGLANIWTEEYGSADDPEMFPHIHAYSPYHRTVEGTDYPAILVTGSENDARTDPAHARKFAAAVRWADSDQGSEEPILLHIQSASGHGGAVTIDQNADQYSRHFGFLMEQIGMVAPEAPAEGGSN